MFRTHSSTQPSSYSNINSYIIISIEDVGIDVCIAFEGFVCKNIILSLISLLTLSSISLFSLRNSKHGNISVLSFVFCLLQIFFLLLLPSNWEELTSNSSRLDLFSSISTHFLLEDIPLIHGIFDDITRPAQAEPKRPREIQPCNN